MYSELPTSGLPTHVCNPEVGKREIHRTAVREGAKFKSGQIVVKKVKWTYFDAYQWQTMWNYTKKSMEGSKLSDLVFLQWEVTDWQELFAKNAENKGN